MNRKPSKTIAIATGGTGGHIFPAMAFAECMLSQDYNVIVIADRRFMKFAFAVKQIIKHPNLVVEYIDITRKSGVIGLFKTIWQVLTSTNHIISLIQHYKIEAMISFGGYASFPSVLASKTVKVPIILHEQNSYLGLANRMSIWLSKVCLTGFPVVRGVPKLQMKKLLFVGNPVRKEIKNLHYRHTFDNINYDAFYKIYDTITILIISGSQAAKIFADVVPFALSSLSTKIKQKLKVYHQTRPEDIQNVETIYQKAVISAEVKTFFVDVADLMSRAHLMICRSGASTVAEITCLGVPSILIPYKLAKNDHQTQNAMFLQSNGAAMMIHEDDLSAMKLSGAISLALKDEGLLGKMHLEAHNLAKPDAEIQIAIATEMILYGKVISPFEESIMGTKKPITDKMGIC